jgi:hypothetical protein
MQNANNWQDGAMWRRVLPTASGSSLSIRCHHCEKPACLTVCPFKAYTIRGQDTWQWEEGGWGWLGQGDGSLVQKDVGQENRPLVPTLVPPLFQLNF